MKNLLLIVQSEQALTHSAYILYLRQKLSGDLNAICTKEECHAFCKVLLAFASLTDTAIPGDIQTILDDKKSAVSQNNGNANNEQTMQDIALLDAIVMAKKNIKGEFLAAVKRGDRAAVTNMLAVGAIDVDGKDEEGVTPLIIAADKGFNDIFEILLKRRADINARDKKGNGLIAIALVRNNAKVLELLSGTQRGQELLNDFINLKNLMCDKIANEVKEKPEHSRARLKQHSIFDVGLNNSALDSAIKALAYYNEAHFLVELFARLKIYQDAKVDFESLIDDEKIHFMNSTVPLLLTLENLTRVIAKNDEKPVWREIYRMVKVLVSDENRDVKLQAIHTFELAVKAKPSSWEKYRPTLTVSICAAVGLVLGITLVGALGMFFGVWSSPITLACALYGLATASSITAWSLALVGVPVISCLATGFMAKRCFFKPSPLEKIVTDAHRLVPIEQVPKLQ